MTMCFVGVKKEIYVSSSTQPLPSLVLLGQGKQGSPLNEIRCNIFQQSLTSQQSRKSTPATVALNEKCDLNSMILING